MPVGYLDVPTGADPDRKSAMVRAIYEAVHEVYPFPDDTRIFVREWSPDAVSQNGLLGSEPARPVFMVHVPPAAGIDAKRTMLRKIGAAVGDAYDLPDFMTFVHEHPLDLVALDGGLLADDRQRVGDRTEASIGSARSGVR
ncbi:hypothetical protein [Saccharothrix luteola]|uniref:hypothetical protein n=1 Tax=Saccharothrix luteola TaxID=2893018 RepID=UPI001E633789|nr:hypothetical protein [Saccharothrix luteola]MCC8244107.1 hypothetical protein [Saccharothrix luteola]